MESEIEARVASQIHDKIVQVVDLNRRRLYEKRFKYAVNHAKSKIVALRRLECSVNAQIIREAHWLLSPSSSPEL